MTDADDVPAASGQVPVFVGTLTNRMTPKNQVALPAPFRASCSEPVQKAGFVLRQRRPGDRHLNLFPRAEFDRMYTGVYDTLARKEDQREAERFLRLWSQNTHHLWLDAQGRITMPKTMLDLVGIPGPDLVFAGCRYRIEIWDPAEYDRANAPSERYVQWAEGSAGSEKDWLRL